MGCGVAVVVSSGDFYEVSDFVVILELVLDFLWVEGFWSLFLGVSFVQCKYV